MRFFVFFAILSMVSSGGSFAEGAQTPTTNEGLQSNYPDTTTGLQRLLIDAISAAHADREADVDEILHGMQIPDFKQWFAENEGHSESWAEAYGKQVASPDFGVSLKSRFREFARRKGEVIVRRLNDGPNQPNGFEDGWLRNLRKPQNIYEANWRDERANADAKPQWIGYFVYANDAFRWYSIVRLSIFDDPRGLMPRHIAMPHYPYSADGRHPGGFVHLTLVVREDGSVTDVKPNGAVESTTDEKLIKAGVEAVRQFQFQRTSHQSPGPMRIDDFRIMVCPREAN